MKTRTVIEIDEGLCNGCGQCVTGCHEGALQMIEGKARLVGDSLCDGLGACIGECPVGAIRFVEREATAYSEREVLERLVPLGEATVVAHLKHLKENGQKDLVHEGLDILAEKGWDVAALRGKVQSTGVSLARPVNSDLPAQSALRQWPVQLRLVPPAAPFLENADLVVAADCMPFAYANFHQDFLRGKVLLIGCPKLDDNQAYAQKFAQIFQVNHIRSVTVLRMEVPCCGGISQSVKAGLAASGALVPYAEATISIEGKLLPPR